MEWLLALGAVVVWLVILKAVKRAVDRRIAEKDAVIERIHSEKMALYDELWRSRTGREGEGE